MNRALGVFLFVCVCVCVVRPHNMVFTNLEVYNPILLIIATVLYGSSL